MSSASLQLSVNDDYLHRELAKGRIAGPFSSPLLPHLYISRFGVIPKTPARQMALDSESFQS